MAKAISEYSLEKHLAKVVESIVSSANHAEGFEIVISAKANEIPTVSFKVDKVPVQIFSHTRKDEYNG